MGKRKEVLEFIKTVRDSFYGSVEVYTRGSCYKFYEILKLVFPEAEAYYDSSHVITKINDKYYDITGEVELGTHLLIGDEHYTNSTIKECRYSIHQHVIYCEDCDCDWKIL